MRRSGETGAFLRTLAKSRIILETYLWGNPNGRKQYVPVFSKFFTKRNLPCPATINNSIKAKNARAPKLV
jgi:hypothetical protein